MWPTPPSGEDLDHFPYGDSPTCGSGTSTSNNLSPVSPTGSWSSPATSFHQPADRPGRDTWGDLTISTPVSVDGCFSGSASDASPLPVGAGAVDGRGGGSGAHEDPFDIYSAKWHCEPLATTAGLPTLAGMDAVSCPASPAGLPLSTSAYMLSIDSPTGQFDADMESSRGSEPPGGPESLSGSAAASAAVAATATPEQQIPYAQLIYKALAQAPDHSMSLQEIYQWFQENTEKCKPGQRGWMNSIRHNLSMNAVSKPRCPQSLPLFVDDDDYYYGFPFLFSPHSPRGCCLRSGSFFFFKAQCSPRDGSCQGVEPGSRSSKTLFFPL